MTDEPEEQPERNEGVFALFSRTDVRVWTVIMVAGCMAIVVVAAPPEWSLPMKLLGGFVMGVIAMFSVFVPRMIGGDDFI